VPHTLDFIVYAYLQTAQLPFSDNRFPAAQSITYFARALGAARSGNAAAARAEIAHLDEAEAKLAAASDDYWGGQTRIQKQAAAAWVMFSEGQRDCSDAQGGRSRRCERKERSDGE
jgi:hypothetical protein